MQSMEIVFGSQLWQRITSLVISRIHLSSTTMLYPMCAVYDALRLNDYVGGRSYGHATERCPSRTLHSLLCLNIFNQSAPSRINRFVIGTGTLSASRGGPATGSSTMLLPELSIRS